MWKISFNIHVLCRTEHPSHQSSTALYVMLSSQPVLYEIPFYVLPFRFEIVSSFLFHWCSGMDLKWVLNLKFQMQKHGIQSARGFLMHTQPYKDYLESCQSKLPFQGAVLRDMHTCPWARPSQHCWYQQSCAGCFPAERLSLCWRGLSQP